MSTPAQHLQAGTQAPAAHVEPGPAYMPPTGAQPVAGGTLTVPAGGSAAPLPTPQQYNSLVDPKAATSAEDKFLEQQQGMNPQAGGARLTEQRLKQIETLAQQRAEHLEMQNQKLMEAVGQTNQAVTQLATTQQQHLQQQQQPPAVDPMEQFRLNEAEAQSIEGQDSAIQKMVAAGVHQATSTMQETHRAQMAEMQQKLDQATQGLQQDVAANRNQQAKNWQTELVADVTAKYQVDLLNVGAEVNWESFANQVVPHSGGLTYFDKFKQWVQAENKPGIYEIMDDYMRYKQAVGQQQDPAAYAPVGGVTEVRQDTGVNPGAVSGATAGTQTFNTPQEELMHLTRQYSELTRKLQGRGMSVPDFENQTKPINERIGALQRQLGMVA